MRAGESPKSKGEIITTENTDALKKEFKITDERGEITGDVDIAKALLKTRNDVAVLVSRPYERAPTLKGRQLSGLSVTAKPIYGPLPSLCRV